MTYWIPFAFVRITLYFIAGILCGIFIPGLRSHPEGWMILLSLLLSYIGFFILYRRTHNRVFNPGLIAFPAIVVAGILSVDLANEVNRDDHISRLQQAPEFYRVTLIDVALDKPKSWKQTGHVDAVRVGNKWKKFSGKIVLYFSKETVAVPYRYGEVLLVRHSFQEIPPPANPGEFDYRRFMSFRKVFHQHTVHAKDILFVDYAPPSDILAFAFNLRKLADQKLKSLVLGHREKALASALVLGVVDGLDNELLGAYAATGAMHVLAVSGLHVGILYWIILTLLTPLKSRKWGRWPVAIFSFVALWGYACITGLSPSVLRAVVMFSFVIIAQPFNLRTNIYNILAASAFCILLYDPYLIMSVGFQLSYLAVLGIVYLQPLLYDLVEFESRVMDEIWKITCVSIAAQLSTFMLGLLYFHQFPVYFLISNLFVIPLSFVILIVGLLALSMSFSTWIGGALGFCLTWLIKILNYLVFWVESWPNSLIDNIYMSPLQCVILGAFVLAICFYIEHRRFRYLITACVLVIGVSVLNWTHYVATVAQPELVVYKIPGGTGFEVIKNGIALSYYDSSDMRKGSDAQRLVAKGNHLIRCIHQIQSLKEYSGFRNVPGGHVLRWNGIWLVHVTGPEFAPDPEFYCDVIIFSKNSFRNLDLMKYSAVPHIIFDSSNNRTQVAKILDTLRGNGKFNKIHSVWHDGAFELEL
jgi:competence protein ComEC